MGVKRLLRYLKGTIDVALTFQKVEGSLTQPVMYTDADWGGSLKDRKSTSGYCCMFAGSVIDWSSKKQPTVATSTCQAEYVSLAETVKEAIAFKRFINDLDLFTDTKGIVIYCDNQSAIKIALKQTNSERVKHIDIKHHFIKDEVYTRNSITRIL